MAGKTVKTGKWMNLIPIVVLIGVFAYLIYNTYTETQKSGLTTEFRNPLEKPKTPTEIRLENFKNLEKKYNDKTIEYYDQDYGFSMRYPIGYGVAEQPFAEVEVRFGAFYPPFDYEWIDVRPLNESYYTSGAIESTLAELAGKENIGWHKEQGANGASNYFSSFKQAEVIADNETVYTRMAFYGCKDLFGKPYWLSIISAVSQNLAPDLEVVEYMEGTVTC